MSEYHSKQYTHRLTYLETALAEQLHERGASVITSYDLFLTLRSLYQSGRQLYLRKSLPDTDDLNRRRRNLLDAHVLKPDMDYSYGVYRVTDNNDQETEAIICLVDPFCCVAYLSAMARYGLTVRRPRGVHIKSPDKQLRRRWVEKRMAQDYGEDLDKLEANQVVRLRGISHPSTVRGRSVTERHTRHMGAMVTLRDSDTRLTTIGQTFVDMLEHPEACGGMAHVLEGWDEHADLYVDQIVAAIDQNPRPIIKVRAGYILDERLGIADNDERIQAWTHYAQRGGSRVLDPDEPFVPHFSAKWMLSLNVG